MEIDIRVPVKVLTVSKANEALITISGRSQVHVPRYINIPFLDMKMISQHIIQSWGDPSATHIRANWGLVKHFDLHRR